MKREFCLGSEWLYYKIYTGVQTADLLLLEEFAPVIEQLKAQKVIEKWFLFGITTLIRIFVFAF